MRVDLIKHCHVAAAIGVAGKCWKSTVNEVLASPILRGEFTNLVYTIARAYVNERCPIMDRRILMMLMELTGFNTTPMVVCDQYDFTEPRCD